jgi:hypothetical protein
MLLLAMKRLVRAAINGTATGVQVGHLCAASWHFFNSFFLNLLT